MKIVIIKLGALGDIIMATSVIKAIMSEHRNDELFLLTSTHYAELFSDWEGLSVRAFPRSGLKASIKTVAWLRSQHVDRIYDLQSNDRSRILCILSGANEKVGNHDHFPYTHHPGDHYTGQNHIFERHRQLLASANIRSAENRPWLPVPQEAVEKVECWIQKHKLDKNRLVLLHAGASPLHPQKRWPHFSGLAELLSAAGYDLVWLGAGEDAIINAQLATIRGVDATNAFTIFELIALARSALLAITNDSGPMHVLACAALPVYALFGPTNWRRCHAIGQKECVISLNKSNSVWKADEYSGVDPSQLASITAEMVFSLLVKEKCINQ